MRRVGVLMHATSDEPEPQARLAAFAQGLQEAGWSVGRDVRIETRWSTGDAARLRRDAAELVALNLDISVVDAIGGLKWDLARLCVVASPRPARQHSAGRGA